MNIILKAWRWMFGDVELLGLTPEEYEEYEFLGALLEWRDHDHEQAARFADLSKRREEYYAGIK